MDAVTYIRALAERWAAEPELWDWNAETPRDVRNMLRDIADNIENGKMELP